MRAGLAAGSADSMRFSTLSSSTAGFGSKRVARHKQTGSRGQSSKQALTRNLLMVPRKSLSGDLLDSYANNLLWPFAHF